MAGFRAQPLVARDPRGTVGFRTIKAGAHRVRLALLRGGGSRAVAILHPEGGDTLATRRTNPSRRQRARSELKRDQAYQGRVQTGMPSYRSNKAIRAAMAGDRERLMQAAAAVRRAKMLKRRPNPPRAPKRSARTGRFVAR